MAGASHAERNIHIFFLYVLYTYLYVLANNPVFHPFPQLISIACVGALTLKFAKWDRK